MRPFTLSPFAALTVICGLMSIALVLSAAQQVSPPEAPQAEPDSVVQATPTNLASESAALSDEEKHALLERVVTNQKNDELAQFTYERLERLEVLKNLSSPQPAEVKFSRAVPAGTGIDRIPVGPEGKPLDAAAYRTELEKLERSLSWAAQDGRAQREAYDKIAKKQKERADLIDATRTAFLYTFVAHEKRGERTL